MTEEQYRAQYDEDDTVGWDAIDAALKTLYGDIEPRHYASIVKYATGGEDPLDGTSIADNPLLITDLRRTKNYI